MSTLSRHYPEIQGELEDESEYENNYFEGEGMLPGQGAAFEEEYEFEFETEAEAESEFEEEYEFEDEAEDFVNPVKRVYRDAEMMAHLAKQASMTESESEAEAFIGALIPLASRLIPRAASLIARHAPTLVRSATRITKQLRRDPTTSRYVRALPVVLQRTAQSLADQAAAGKPITMQTVIRTANKISGRVLGPDARNALRAVEVFERRWRRRARWEDARRRPDGFRHDYRRPLPPTPRPPSIGPAYVCPR